MDSHVASILSELQQLLSDLGQGGGILTPSVYDTAQVLRLAPLPEEAPAAYAWLLEQQHSDGGWNAPAAPYFRDTATLAAILALKDNKRSASPACLPPQLLARAEESCRAGIEFLDAGASQWREPLPRSKPSGVELTLSKLLDEAASMQIRLKGDYSALFKRRDKGQPLMESLFAFCRPLACLTWDAWGSDPQPEIVTSHSGVGHAPASTARWIQLAAVLGRSDGSRDARHYLQQAHDATGMEVPGIYPTTWPITRYEQAFSLFALLAFDLLEHSALAPAIHSQAEVLQTIMSDEGIGCTDTSTRDGDDTAAALAVLLSLGKPIGLSPLEPFFDDDHYCTWPFHIQPSLSITARAILVHSLLQRDADPMVVWLEKRRQPNGRWDDDPWNLSWLYTTGHIVHALIRGGYVEAARPALDALIHSQHDDGGFGVAESSLVESAWAAMALREARKNQLAIEEVLPCILRLRHYLGKNYASHQHTTPLCWIAKDVYSPHRIDRAYVLAATLDLWTETK